VIKVEVKKTKDLRQDRGFVYFYVEVMNPGRYYVTAKATARNPVYTQARVQTLFDSGKRSGHPDLPAGFSRATNLYF
jgi:hypothetical protein